MFIECTGALTAGRNLIVPANKKLYFIYNNTTGGFAVTVKVSGQTGVSVANGKKVLLVSNGTDIVLATNSFSGSFDGTVGATTPSTGAFTTLSASGATTVSNTFPKLILKRSNSTTSYGSLDFVGSDNAVDWQVSTNNAVGIAGFEISEGEGTNNCFLIAPGGKLTLTETTTASLSADFKNTSASPYGLALTYTTADPNNTTNEFLVGYGNASTVRFSMRSNGGLTNYSANNVNLSDQREKKDIQLAGSYLDKICAIPVKTFLFNDQTDGDLNLGVIAQDVQAVAPELVSESDWGTKDEPKMRYGVYQTDLQYALMKSIQELAIKVSALEAK
jgi:hypothetical protein